MFQACRADPLLKGLQIEGKGADQNFGPFLPTGARWLNFIKILIFSTYNLIGLGSPLQVSSM